MFKVYHHADHVELRGNKFTGMMGDYISSNIEEIFEWIKNNCKGGARFEGLIMLYTIKFDLNEDITLFTLRWL